MAKFFKDTNRKRAICALSVTLCAAFSLSVFAACSGNTAAEEEPEEEAASPVDTQLLKNGNFEFYSESEKELDEKRNFIATPSNWTFTSGSPSSDTRSGLIETAEWDYIAKPGKKFESVADAYARWKDDDVTLYDRLEFMDLVTKKEADGGFKETYDALSSSSAEKKLFGEYSYTVDFEDIEKLGADFADGIKLHDGAAENETAVLMIHNSRSVDGVYGTGQYYTSSTTVTLEAGTAAEITGWVRTDKLFHYYTSNEETELTRRGGAYIGIINTVGGSTLDEMQIKNINTQGTWQKYTVYVKASTYASTTFRIKLGLGQGTSSDNRYENVNGYAFFDDFKVTKFRAEEFEAKAADASCNISSKKDEKIFDVSDTNSLYKGKTVFKLDLYSGESRTPLSFTKGTGENSVEISATEEISGSSTYSSYYPDNSREGEETSNVADVKKYSELAELAESNLYFKNIYSSDFEDKFPFYSEGTAVNGELPVLLILSANKAAYTAKMRSDAFSLGKDEKMLISFFAKTSDIRSGKTGAGISVVDEKNNKTSISAFNSTAVAAVDIDKDKEELSDIYKGWVQCFFFVSNDSDETQTFHLEFTFGPTAVSTAAATDYAQGYAAFTNFETSTLTKKQYGYASTNDRAVKVSLTGGVSLAGKFDDAQGSAKIEEGLATPASFKGALAGSKFFDDESEVKNALPDNVKAGLLDYESRDKYYASTEDWANKLKEIGGNDEKWWQKAFGDANDSSVGTSQPLVYLNLGTEAAPSYGYIASETTVSANTSRKIGLRVKASVGAKVNIYLIDTSETTDRKVLSPSVPQITYWYDDDGNICASDPTAKDFDEKTGILYYLEENGLYTKAGEKDGKYYANLHNYKTDESGNLLADDDTIVFYSDGNGKIFAYRTEESKGKYTYSTEVNNLPENIARYTAPETAYEAKITVEGKESNKGRWTDVAFYVRTGSKEKNYRVEIWIGERGSSEKTFPAGGYVFLDNYNGTGTVSDYEGTRDIYVKKLKETKKLGTDDNLPATDALYYTFTFFDSLTYKRYDKTTDETGVDPWGSYDQSAYKEGIVYLKADDAEGALANNPVSTVWLDFTPIDTAVTADTPDETPDDSDTDTDNSAGGEVNVWLIVSSALLAVVLIFAIVAVAVRAIGKKVKRAPKVRSHVKGRKRRKAKKAPEEGGSEEAPAPESESNPDDDPYSE